MAILIQIKTSNETRSLELKTGLTIGRSRTASCIINDELLSRLHFELSLHHDGSVLIKDLDSKNGTKLNGEKIKGTHTLYLGDEVSVGKMLLHLDPSSMSPEELKLHTRPNKDLVDNASRMTCLVSGLEFEAVNDYRKASKSLENNFKLDKTGRFKISQGRNGAKGVLTNHKKKPSK